MSLIKIQIRDNYPKILICNNNLEIDLNYDIYKDFEFIIKWIDDNDLIKSDEIIKLEFEDNIQDFILFMKHGFRIYNLSDTGFIEIFSFLINLVSQVRLLGLNKKSDTFGKIIMFIKNIFNEKILNGNRLSILNCLFKSDQIGMDFSNKEIYEIYNLCLIEDTDDGIPINIFNPNIVEEILNTEYNSNTTKGKLKEIIINGSVKNVID